MNKLVSKYFCYVGLGVFVLVGGGCASQPEILPPQNAMHSCNETSKIDLIRLQDAKLKDLKIYWTDSAPSTCPGPGHPRIIVSAPLVSEWIHIVEVNVPPETPTKDPSWNLGGKSGVWTFLDVPENHRLAKKLFYNTRSATVFHDNPHWGESKNVSRTWIGRLYGFTRSRENRKLEPLISLSWGFTNSANSPHPNPIRPLILDGGAWKADKKLLDSLMAKWGLKSPF